MQKKNLGLIALLLVSAVLLSGCTKKPGNQSVTGNQEQNQGQVNNQENGTVNPKGQYSINELLTMNKPIKCTWKESATGDKDVTNIIYINGKNFYQDVTMGDLGHSYVISDGDYLYMWNDFNETASKMKYSEIKITPQPGQEKAQNNAGLEQKKDFICEKWTVDNSVFNPPQNKNFKDITEEMQQATQEMNNGGLEKTKQQICDLCQNAPNEETKNECLKNAQCDQ